MGPTHSYESLSFKGNNHFFEKKFRKKSSKVSNFVIISLYDLTINRANKSRYNRRYCRDLGDMGCSSVSHQCWLCIHVTTARDAQGDKHHLCNYFYECASKSKLRWKNTSRHRASMPKRNLKTHLLVVRKHLTDYLPLFTFDWQNESMCHNGAF